MSELIGRNHVAHACQNEKKWNRNKTPVVKMMTMTRFSMRHGLANLKLTTRMFSADIDVSLSPLTYAHTHNDDNDERSRRQASKLDIKLSSSLKPKPENKDLVFGKTFTDHMLEIDWTAEKGWHSPVIKPYENFSMSPAVSSLHYGMQCF